MLEKFRQAKQSEIEALRKAEADCALDAPRKVPRPDFAKAISKPEGIAIIAEHKRASPSRGVISSGLTVEEVARQYLYAGAAAMSVLTEESYFDGGIVDLISADYTTGGKLPLLRKDFIFHPLQIRLTATTPASALLLIARLYSSASELRELRECAESFGMAAVVEVFDEHDLACARDAGATIIQVNARDLDTFKVDRGACLDLIEKAKPHKDEIWIAASGMNQARHLREAEAAGFHAALIGEALMARNKPGENLAALLNGLRQ